MTANDACCTCNGGDNPKTCRARPVAPTGDGTAKCSQCEAACPSGSTGVKVEKITIASNSWNSANSVTSCGASLETLHCPTDVDSTNWLSRKSDGSPLIQGHKFKVTVSAGKVTAEATSPLSAAFTLEFNCLRCAGGLNIGPFRTEINAPASVVRTSSYKWASAPTRLQVVDYQTTSWQLAYFEDASKVNVVGDNYGEAWGLYLTKTAQGPDEEKSFTAANRGAQKFTLDWETGQLKVTHNSFATEKCVNLFPRDSDGLFWPTDSGWKSAFGSNYLTGRYVTVTDCLDFDTAKETKTDAVLSTSTGVTKEGQTWEVYDCTTTKSIPGSVRFEKNCKLRNKRTKMCLAKYGNNCDNQNNGKCTGGTDCGADLYIIGLSTCDSSQSLRFTDMEDNSWQTGEPGQVASGLTQAQVYRKAILPDKARKMDGKVEVSWCRTGLCDIAIDAKTGGATLFKNEMQFRFSQGDMVYSSKFTDVCQVGVVESCDDGNDESALASMGYCADVSLLPLATTECPTNRDLVHCKTAGLKVGVMCEGDGECGTDNDLDNCGDTWDIYKVTGVSWDGGSCKVNWGGTTETVEALSLSPADYEWPNAPLDV